MRSPLCVIFFFFNDTATTEIYTLSLHDALPISHRLLAEVDLERAFFGQVIPGQHARQLAQPPGLSRRDRKSTRLNSSHSQISYAVFCLKKKNNIASELLHSDTRQHAVDRNQPYY